jgi:CspA family cold shock protein
MTGTVRWYEPKRGFGFIEPDDGGEPVFVHYACVADLPDSPDTWTGAAPKVLEPGQKVEFEVVEAPYGRQATRVRRVGQ